MDAKKYVREFLRAHKGIAYSAKELAVELSEYDRFDIPVEINPDEVRTYGAELANEEDSIHHDVAGHGSTVVIDGEAKPLFLDYEYLRYDVVADFAPMREHEVEDMSPESMRDWIVAELADEVEDDFIEHSFKWEEPI